MYAEQDYEEEEPAAKEAREAALRDPTQAMFVDFAERDDAPPLLTAQQKKL